MSGLHPQRPPDWNGFNPAKGWDPHFDWQGFTDYKDLPRTLNPASGYIATANQDLNSLGKVSPINMPMGDYRARRIEQVLAANDAHDIESTRKLQLDVHSIQAGLFLDVLLPLLQQESINGKASRILSEWDQQYDLESRGAVLFEKFYTALRQEVFGQTGLGEDIVRHLAEQTGIFIDFYQNFDRVILNKKSCWYQEKTQEEAFVAAYKVTAASDEGKRWKDENAIPWVNQLLQGKLPAFMGFDTPPIPLPGGRATPQQGQIYKSGGRQTSFAPSVRLIADMSESVIHTCLAGGPSDNRFSKWYKTGIDAWKSGNYKILKPRKSGT
jgi:penicillin amidase